MSQQARPRFNLAMLIAVLLVLTILAALVYALLDFANERGCISSGIGRCRRIVTDLRAYSADHGGKYPDAFLPDPGSSNEVFRVLLKEGVPENEMTFGSFVSPFRPDGVLGAAPDFQKALEAGENHWAMTEGLTDSMPPAIPLVYENPAVSTWPPKWNPSASGKPRPGRGWLWAGSIILGRNDSSVSVAKLESRWGSSVGLAKSEDGKDLFEAVIDPTKFPKGAVLNILQKASMAK